MNVQSSEDLGGDIEREKDLDLVCVMYRGSNPGPDTNFSLKCINLHPSVGYLLHKNFHHHSNV